MFTRALLAAASCAAAATLVTAVPAEAASPIQLGKIQYDSPGTDSRTNGSLNAEYVVIKNTGRTSRVLTGWTLRDTSNHVYKFGTFRLGAGKTVVVRTGKGTNTASTRYWGSGSYVWNNTGDKAYLRASNGTLADSCAWSSKGAGYKNC
jgi:Lamin Tail Domain